MGEAVLGPCSSTSCFCPTCEVFGSGERSGASVERILVSVGLDKAGERLGQVLAAQGSHERRMKWPRIR